jgi:hypothetical protein
LKADATLSRYADIPSLAKAHIEAHKVAKSKIVIPAEDAGDEAWGAFYNQLGRPETPDAYTIPMPELPVDAPQEARELLAQEYKPFRELAHSIGLNAKQAEALGKFELDRQNAFYAQGESEIKALREALGQDYEPKVEAGRRAFARIFGDDEEALALANELDKKVGSARLVKASMRLAEIMGEHGLIDSDTVEGFGEVKDAEAKIAELQKDASWREKFNNGDAGVRAQYNRLLDLAKKQAVRTLNTGNVN